MFWGFIFRRSNFWITLLINSNNDLTAQVELRRRRLWRLTTTMVIISVPSLGNSLSLGATNSEADFPPPPLTAGLFLNGRRLNDLFGLIEEKEEKWKGRLKRIPLPSRRWWRRSLFY